MGKILLKTLWEDRKEFLGKKGKLLKNVIGNIIEIGNNTAKHAIMRRRPGELQAQETFL